MTKRLIDIEDELLAEAQRRIGTSTMKETVNDALQHVVDFDLRLSHICRLITMEGIDLADDDIMREAWR